MLKTTEKLLKAVSDRNRLRILNMLFAKPMCVCEVTDILNLSQSTVSGHLRVLKDSGIINDEKDGLWINYNIQRTDNFTNVLIDSILISLSEDKDMVIEREKAKKTDRNQICKK